MICFKCKQQINNNICPHCGYINNEKVLEYLNDPNIKRNISEYYQNINNTTLNNNQDNSIVNVFNGDNSNNIKYIKAFIGDKYNEFVNGGISWCCFLFGYIYIVYRKMYGYAIIVFFLSFFINLFSNLFLTSIVWIFIAFRFKDKYVLYVNNQVNEIKKACSNASEEELLLICKEKGGTNILMVILVIILTIVIRYIAYYLSQNGGMNL